MTALRCPDCGFILMPGRDIHGHCYTCHQCGLESCDITDLVEVIDSEEDHDSDVH